VLLLFGCARKSSLIEHVCERLCLARLFQHRYQLLTAGNERDGGRWTHSPTPSAREAGAAETPRKQKPWHHTHVKIPGHVHAHCERLF
jgi:hypothetical protein